MLQKPRLVELNVDLGELPDEPAELYTLATTVNVACGGHAGDRASIERALDAAKKARARVAAHPSYPDREGFGRRARFCDARELAASVREQCALIAQVARERGLIVDAMKPHGALYHDASADDVLGAALLDAAKAALPDLTTIVAAPGSRLHALSIDRHLAYQREGFADRRYLAPNVLAPRSHAGALLSEPDECAHQAVDLAQKADIETLCVHGDTPNAVVIARAVRTALETAGLLR